MNRPFLLVASIVVLFGAGSMLRAHFLDRPAAAAAQTIDDRYRDIRAMLPRHGRVAFISDLPFDHEGGDTFHLQTIYALAPLIVVRDEGAPGLVVARLSDPALLPSLCRSRRLEVVRDRGKGVALLRRRIRN